MEEDAVNFLSSLSVRHHSDSYGSDNDDNENQDMTDTSLSDPFSPEKRFERKGRKSVPRKHVQRHQDSSQEDINLENLDTSIKQEVDDDECISEYFPPVSLRKHKRKHEPIKHSIDNDQESDSEDNQCPRQTTVNSPKHKMNKHTLSNQEDNDTAEIDEDEDDETSTSSKKTWFGKGAKLDSIIAQKLQKS